jgi:hypothetical protein
VQDDSQGRDGGTADIEIENLGEFVNECVEELLGGLVAIKGRLGGFLWGSSGTNAVETHEKELRWMKILTQLPYLLLVEGNNIAGEVEDGHWGDGPMFVERR